MLYIILDASLDHMARKSPRLKGNDPADVKPGAAAIPESGGQATISGMAVLVGTVLDGIPENAAIGMGLASDEGAALGFVLLGAVFLSNLPGAITSTVGMRQSGRSKTYVALAWALVAIACTLSTVGGYALLADLPDTGKSFLLALAAGSILAMLSDTMFPEAFRDGGVALATTAGFAVALMLGEIT